jgi:predicted aspartyl protease
LALLALSQPAAATCIVSHQATVPATFAHGKAYVPVQMNEATALFMIDTGVAETIVNAPFAAEAGAGMDRRAGPRIYGGAGGKLTLPVYTGHVRMTHIGDIHFQDWEYGIVDLGNVGPRDMKFGGILGVDFMHYFDIEIDHQAKTVSIYRLSGCSEVRPPSWSGDYAAIPLKHTPSHNLTLPVFLDNADLDMELDTGAGSFLLSRDAAARAGVTAAALAHDEALHGAEGIGGRFAAVRHRFNLLLIGKGVYPNPDLAVENEVTQRGETDGLVGLSAFKAQRLWISFTTSTLFVQGAPGTRVK